jgi:hypothetical protein
MVRTNFTKACARGDYDDVCAQLRNGIEHTNMRAGFAACCMRGDMRMIQLFIEYGMDDWTHGLHNACRGGHLDIAQYMIAKGACYLGQEIIDSACDSGNVRLVMHLLGRGHSTELAFNRACRKAKFELIEYLRHCPDVDIDAALIQAIHGGQLQVMYILLEMGGRIDMPRGGEIACKRGLYDIVKFLLFIGERNFGTALYGAWGHRSIHIMQLLLSTPGVVFTDFPHMFESLCARVPQEVVGAMIYYAAREKIRLNYTRSMKQAVKYGNLYMVMVLHARGARITTYAYERARKHNPDILQFFDRTEGVRDDKKEDRRESPRKS